MPKFLETTLKREAASKGLTGRAADRYAFGALNNMGAMHGNEETPKGAAMEAKHDAKLPHPARNLGAHMKPSKGSEVVTNHHRSAKKR